MRADTGTGLVNVIYTKLAISLQRQFIQYEPENQQPPPPWTLDPKRIFEKFWTEKSSDWLRIVCECP